MMYWEEMRSKYGFNDGGSEPIGVEEHRRVYVDAMNALLEKHKSAVRVMAYDRPGLHNHVLIVNVPKEHVAQLTREQINGGDGPLPAYTVERPKEDSGFHAASKEAQDLNLDQFVEVKATVNEDGLASLLDAICD